MSREVYERLVEEFPETSLEYLEGKDPAISVKADDLFEVAGLQGTGVEAKIVVVLDVDAAGSGLDVDLLVVSAVADIDVARGCDRFEGQIKPLAEAEVEGGDAEAEAAA